MDESSAPPIEFLGLPRSAETALAVLPEPMRAWFRRRFGAPTPAQRLALPAVAAGKNVLRAAPTGGGKTLAACLPVLSQLLEGNSFGSIRLLYVAPLKALLSDVRLTLRRCLRELRPADVSAGDFLRVGA